MDSNLNGTKQTPQHSEADALRENVQRLLHLLAKYTCRRLKEKPGRGEVAGEQKK
jgi:hypothetical protein